MNLQILILVLAVGTALAWRLCEFASDTLARRPSVRPTGATTPVPGKQRR